MCVILQTLSLFSVLKLQVLPTKYRGYVIFTDQIITQYSGKFVCHFADVCFFCIKITGNPPSAASIWTDFNLKNNAVVFTTSRFWMFFAEWLSAQVVQRNCGQNLSSCGHKMGNTLVSSSIFNLKTCKICHKFTSFVAPQYFGAFI